MSSAAWTGKCGGDQTAPSNMIVIEDGSKPFQSMMYLNVRHWYWGMNARENTLNDTAMIGIMPVPPGKTGLLFKVECFTDSIPFSYRPYKVTKGKLVIEYFSGNF